MWVCKNRGSKHLQAESFETEFSLCKGKTLLNCVLTWQTCSLLHHWFLSSSYSFYKVFLVLPPQNRLLWRHQPKKNERISDWCQTQVSQNKLDFVKDLKTWRKIVIRPRKEVILSVFYVDAMWQKNAKVKNNFSGKGMNFKHFISLRQNVLTSEP